MALFDVTVHDLQVVTGVTGVAVQQLREADTDLSAEDAACGRGVPGRDSCNVVDNADAAMNGSARSTDHRGTGQSPYSMAHMSLRCPNNHSRMLSSSVSRHHRWPVIGMPSLPPTPASKSSSLSTR